MHGLWRQLVFEKQFLRELVDQSGRHPQREAAAELRLDVLSHRGVIFNVCCLLHLWLSRTQPFVTVECKTVPGACAGNRPPIEQRRFAHGHLLLGLPIRPTVAEAVFDFAG